MDEIKLTKQELEDLIFWSIQNGRHSPYLSVEEYSSLRMTDAFKIASKRIVEEFIEEQKLKYHGR